ncbi:hypothetical protein AB4Y96_23405 [Phyllobacterium sp. TAF24]|uniref:hypothetical protein n=1 Tax=unclassified Phyllobacterium TaxID=2638441 RepID=UPI00087F6313|nr:hypothetical protein [Phyllobacterium sp. OV277]SDP05987.1 hypothetical protein SAMN05443582_103290 [Phyllobacterium sp. OV277]
MGPSDFGFSAAARAGMMQEAYRQQDEYNRQREEVQNYASSINSKRTDWNLVDAKELGVSVSTPVAKLGVTLGHISIPMVNRKTGEQIVFTGGGLGGTLGITFGLSVLTVKVKDFKVKGSNELAKLPSTGEAIGPVPGTPVIDGEIGVPIFKGPYWKDSDGSDQFSGAVGITTGTLMTPSRESIGIFNLVSNLFKDPKSLIPKTHNLVALTFYNWKAVPFLLNPPMSAMANYYIEAIALCTKEGHGGNLAGIQGKQAFFKVSRG